MRLVSRLNDLLAIHLTLALGTMFCTYAFVVLCVLPLAFPRQQDNILYVSNCCQLAFLPILLTGQNLIGRKAEERAAQDHAAIMDSHALIHAEVMRLQAIQDAIMSLNCIQFLAEGTDG